MTEKKRPPRFDDIVARSHRPPAKRPVSPFAAAYDADEARKKAGLDKVSPANVPLVDTNPTVDTNQQVDTNVPQVGAKVDTNSSRVDTKAPTLVLTPTNRLTPTAPLTPTSRLTPKKKSPPSWRMSRLSIRLDKEKLDRLHFIAMSRGITLQDLIGGWADVFLADEGLTPTKG